MVSSTTMRKWQGPVLCREKSIEYTLCMSLNKLTFLHLLPSGNKYTPSNFSLLSQNLLYAININIYQLHLIANLSAQCFERVILVCRFHVLC